MNIEYKAPDKNAGKEGIDEKKEKFNEKLPFIKFPADFEVKLTNYSSKTSPLNFLVKKEGAPSGASVIVWTGNSGEDIPQWEIMSSSKGNGVDGDSLQRVPLDDTERLVKAIEKALYFNPDEDGFHEEEDGLESSTYLDAAKWLSEKKDLKEKMGPELEKIYVDLVDETRKEYEKWILNSAAEIIKKGPPPMKGLEEIYKLISRTTEDVMGKIRDNHIIKQAIEKKPDVMVKVLEMTDQETRVYYDGFLSGGKSSLAKYIGE